MQWNEVTAGIDLIVGVTVIESGIFQVVSGQGFCMLLIDNTFFKGGFDNIQDAKDYAEDLTERIKSS